MRVLIVHNRYQQAGGEDMVVALEAEMLARAGHDVQLAEVNNDGIVGLPAKLATLLHAPYDGRRKDWIGDAIVRSAAEVVHVHNFFPLLTPAIHDGAAAHGVAVVQTLHNFRLICAGAMLMRDGHVCEDCLNGSRAQAVVHRCYRGSVVGSAAVVAMQSRAERKQTWARSVDRFIALTDFARGKFVEGRLPAETIVVKPNAVPWSAAPQPRQRDGALFVGRLSPEKGVRTLVAAFGDLPEVTLTIVGDGPERAALEQVASPNVRFIGRRDATGVRAAMEAARVLVVPSIWYEGFPMTIVEAYAAGLPVIASRIGSLAEVVRDGVTGALAIPGDAADLRRVIAGAMADGDGLARMGAAARAAYEALYSPGPNVAALESIYQAALESAAARRGR